MNPQKNFWADNIKFLRNRKKMGQETLAAALGITRAKLNAHENGNTKNPTVEGLLNFSTYFKISVDNLLKTDLSKIGELKLRELQAGDISGSDLRVLAITVDRNNNENTEYVPVKAKAGYAAGGYSDPDFIMGLPKFSLPGLPKNGSYRIFPISGDSMLPVPDGSRVVGKFIADWNELKPGSACIVILNGNQDFVFKMVTLLDDGNVLLRSLNKLYEPYIVSLGDIQEIWQYYEHHINGMPEPQTDMQQLLQTMEEIKQQVSTLTQTKKGLSSH